VPRSNWLDPAWEDEARGWTLDRLAALGIPATGQVERVRVRPWSVQLRVPTGTGPVWFKANISGAAYEAALVSAFAGWAPQAVLVPLAVDSDRGWLLSPDGGPTLREVQAGTPDLATWEAMLAAYAELQRDMAARAAEMVALGVPDLRPAVLPDRLAGLLDDPGVRSDLGAERHAAINALVPEYADWCAELAADGFPATIQHDDLHDGNVFVVDGRYRFFDWADASVAHPFGSLLVTMRVAGYLFKVEPDAPELVRLRDAYLEPWTADRDRRSALRSAELATRVAIVGRALSWQRALRGAETPIEDDYRTAVAEWLADLVDPAGE
jgi:Phosphotransferase enzyme family